MVDNGLGSVSGRSMTRVVSRWLEGVPRVRATTFHLQPSAELVRSTEAWAKSSCQTLVLTALRSRDLAAK
jgi:hypothetical protein